MAVTYSIGGKDPREYGIYVSGSEGILGSPKLKKLTTFSWDSHHGESVDLKSKLYEPREITLSCFLSARTAEEFILNFTAFRQLFEKPGTCRLEINAIPDKPMLYEVYCKDGIDVSKAWSEDTMTGTFKLKLIEPEPVKRILKFVRSSSRTAINLVLLSNKVVSIYWGDGTVDHDVMGSASPIKHTYSADGDYYIVIAGNIDEVNTTSNATIVWNKL
jgi:hypothetical protein